MWKQGDGDILFAGMRVRLVTFAWLVTFVWIVTTLDVGPTGSAPASLVRSTFDLQRLRCVKGGVAWICKFIFFYATLHYCIMILSILFFRMRIMAPLSDNR